MILINIAFNFPESMTLRNRMFDNTFSMRFVRRFLLDGASRREGDESAVYKMISWTAQCGVTEAFAIVGACVRIKEPKARPALDAFLDKVGITLKIDGFKVLNGLPLHRASPIAIADFQKDKTIYDALDDQGKTMGIFIANGTIVEALLVGRVPKGTGDFEVGMAIELGLYRLASKHVIAQR